MQDNQFQIEKSILKIADQYLKECELGSVTLSDLIGDFMLSISGHKKKFRDILVSRTENVALQGTDQSADFTKIVLNIALY